MVHCLFRVLSSIWNKDLKGTKEPIMFYLAYFIFPCNIEGTLANWVYASSCSNHILNPLPL